MKISIIGIIVLFIFGCNSKKENIILFETDNSKYYFNNSSKFSFSKINKTQAEFKYKSSNSITCRIYFDSIYTQKKIRRLPVIRVKNFILYIGNNKKNLVDTIYQTKDIIVDKYIIQNIDKTYNLDLEIENKKSFNVIVCDGSNLRLSEINSFTQAVKNLLE